MCEIKFIATITFSIDPDEAIKKFPQPLQDLYRRLVDVMVEHGDINSNKMLQCEVIA